MILSFKIIDDLILNGVFYHYSHVLNENSFNNFVSISGSKNPERGPPSLLIDHKAKGNDFIDNWVSNG